MRYEIYNSVGDPFNGVCTNNWISVVQINASPSFRTMAGGRLERSRCSSLQMLSFTFHMSCVTVLLLLSRQSPKTSLPLS